MDALRNPQDPIHKSGPEAERDLFRALSAAASGYPTEMVLGAALNVLVNCIRQANPTRREATGSLDHLVAKARSLLLDKHYDAAGRRRNVFPFHQVVEVPKLDVRKH